MWNRSVLPADLTHVQPIFFPSLMLRLITAKSLQIGGMMLAGLALMTGVVEGSMSKEIQILIVAVGVFYAGWYIDPGEDG